MIIKTNIDVNLMNKHFFYQNNKCNYENNGNNGNSESNGNSENNESNERINKKTIIKPANFLSLNEINISKKIQKIPYYSNYYKILDNYNIIKIGELNDKILEKLDYDYNKKYYLFQYKLTKSYIEFNNYLFFSSFNPKTLIFKAINSYSYLLDSLIILNDNNMCFYNISIKNILFESNNPNLINFSGGILTGRLDESYIVNIIENTSDYTYKPLEIHVLFYLVKNNLDTLSLNVIETICNNYVEKLNVLDLFSDGYKANYRNLCIETLSKYINCSKTFIINDIIKHYDKWDNFSFSILYLYIFGNISRVFSLKETFISKFSIYLTKNIHPEPLKRESLKKSKLYFQELFEKYNNWDFVNKIPNDKLKVLYNKIFE